MIVETVDHENVDDCVDVIVLCSLIDWLVDVCISLFIVVSEDDMLFDIDICVITVEGCVNNPISDTIVEDMDADIELLTVVIGWIDDVSKIDVITFELWSEIDEDVAVWVVVICVNDNDELSIELETPLICVVTNSVSGEDVAVKMDVADECAIVDNDKYSPVLDVSWMVPNIFSLLGLEIPFVVVETDSGVDSCDSIDEVWLLCELSRVVRVDVSDEIDSLFSSVTFPVDNWLVCPVDESVWYDDSSNMDPTTVEVRTDNVSEDISAVVDISADSDKDEYSVEVERSSFVVVKVLVKYPVDSEFLLDTTGV